MHIIFFRTLKKMGERLSERARLLEQTDLEAELEDVDRDRIVCLFLRERTVCLFVGLCLGFVQFSLLVMGIFGLIVMFKTEQPDPQWS